MPFAWKRPCSTPGCPNTARHGYKCDRCREAGRRAREERRPSASARGYGSSAWRGSARAQVERQPYCGICGRTDNLVADHVIPKGSGGSDEDDNLQTLCVGCNTRKGGA